MAGIASSSSSSSEDLTQNEHEKESLAERRPTALDGLLQKRRCELLYELKHLQHGEKPVTGTESRTRVDKFFSKRLQQAASSTPVANVDDVDEHRPQQITVEVEALTQRRSVSSVLQSQSFRRALESTIRGHVNSRLTAVVPQARQRAEDNNTHSTSSSTQPTNVSRAGQSSSSHTTVTSSVPRVAPQHIHHVVDDIADNIPVAVVERTIGDIHREEMVMEISELVHRQMVSQTLQGHFRGTLENHIMERIDASSESAERSVQAIANLPPSNVRRNDFSHLGIMPPQALSDVDDAMSVVSATATATIPFAQTNAAVNRQITSLKSQISELTSMLKVTMEMQVDIQRSIRQEVAAAMNQHADAPSPIRNQRADNSKCLICLDGGADCVFYRCGHLCSCYTCALRLKSQKATCPVCRAPIVDIMRTYRIASE